MQNIFTKGIGINNSVLENCTQNTTCNLEVYIKQLFLRKSILKGFHLELYVSVEKQKMFTGNVIGLLLLMNFREKLR